MMNTLGQSGSESDGNEGELNTPQSSRTGASPSDVMLYLGHKNEKKSFFLTC